MMLPLDEEPFVIDANSRIITVPNQFKNGVGVTGDHLAEIIYFAIDRYYDNTDLMTMQKRIEYSNAKGDKRAVNDFIPNVGYFADKRYPGKILFGWALSNLATEDSGKIEFAVRFYSMSEDVLDFSFSTLPTKIIVNKTLNFDINTPSEPPYSDAIRKRFINAGGSEINNLWPEKPVWFKDFVKERYDINETVNIEAGSKDSGLISYEWYKDDVKIEEGIQNVYLNIEPTEKIKGKKYFHTNKATKEIEPYFGTIPNDNEELFEKVSQYTLSNYGTYKVVAVNTLNNRIAKIMDTAVVLPRPAIPTYEANTNVVIRGGKAILTVSNIAADPKGDIYCAWGNEEPIGPLQTNTNSKEVSEDGIYKLTVSNVLNDETASAVIEFKVITAPIITSSPRENIDLSNQENGIAVLTVAIEEKPDYTYEYQWQISNDFGSSWENVENGITNTYSTTSPGLYRVQVKAKYLEIEAITESEAFTVMA